MGFRWTKRVKFVVNYCELSIEMIKLTRYYTTHQYFLSKRSLYLVVWRISDGKQGLTAILQWLSNIQARAPNSPVIIVGTHYDEIGVSISVEESIKLQQTIRERFIVVMDSEKLGLPKVLDSIEVSCK